MTARKIQVFACLAFALLLTGCYGGGADRGIEEEYVKNNTGFVVTKAGTYDSIDENALITKKNKKDKTVTFYNYKVKKYYTLNYDGTSKLYDKYGEPLSMEQIDTGEIVDITFLKGRKLLNSMQVAADEWRIEETKEFEIDEKASVITIGKNRFSYDESLLVLNTSGEEEKKIELIELTNADVVTFAGVGDNVCSIRVEKGHGYLRLVNADYFEEGWIEIGSRIISRINGDMLYTVPTGSYEVIISKAELKEKRKVSVEENKEEIIDLSGVLPEETVSYGTIVFVITPEDAQVYLDGELRDTTIPVTLEYGIHQLIAKAEGYQTLTQYIKVGQENATLSVALEKGKNISNSRPQASPAPSPEPSPAVITQAVEANTTVQPQTGDSGSKLINGYKITIEAPEDAEVYMDGSYLGKVPVSFAKSTGVHDIILRKEGYVTRSYRISIDDSEKDESFSFSNLDLKAGE